MFSSLQRCYLFFLAVVLVPCLVFAQNGESENLETPNEVQPFDVSSFLASSQQLQDANILKNGFLVTLRVVDRYLDLQEELSIPAQGGRIIGSELLVAVEACLEEHQNTPGNDAAFVVISNREGEVLFSGWLLALFPGASLFEHPRYNIHLKQCSKV